MSPMEARWPCLPCPRCRSELGHQHLRGWMGRGCQAEVPEECAHRSERQGGGGEVAEVAREVGRWAASHKLVVS